MPKAPRRFFSSFSLLFNSIKSSFFDSNRSKNKSSANRCYLAYRCQRDLNTQIPTAAAATTTTTSLMMQLILPGGGTCWRAQHSPFWLNAAAQHTKSGLHQLLKAQFTVISAASNMFSVQLVALLSVALLQSAGKHFSPFYRIQFIDE